MSHIVKNYLLEWKYRLKLFDLVLRPLNVKAKLILVMKPRQDDFKRPMFDIKVDLDEISLNINRDQVKQTKIIGFWIHHPCSFAQYSDLLDLLEFQDYLSVKSKFIKYQIKDTPEQTPSLR